MRSPFSLLLFHTSIIRFCRTLQWDAVRASHSGNSLAYLVFSLLASLIRALFVLLRLHSVHISAGNNEDEGGQMANVAWNALGIKGSVSHNIESFQWPMWLNKYLLCPSLRYPGTPVSSHLARIWQDVHQRLGVTGLSITFWRCWCLWQKRMVKFRRHGLPVPYQ